MALYACLFFFVSVLKDLKDLSTSRFEHGFVNHGCRHTCRRTRFFFNGFSWSIHVSLEPHLKDTVNRCRFWLSMSISNTIRLALKVGPFHTRAWDVSGLLMACCHPKTAVYFGNSLYFQIRVAQTMTDSQPENLWTASCKTQHHQMFGTLWYAGVIGCMLISVYMKDIYQLCFILNSQVEG